MRRVFSLMMVVVAQCACFCAFAGDVALPVDPTAEARLLAAAGAGFRVHRTDHFLIAYDTPEETLRDFVSRVEATYRSACRFLDVLDIAHQAPSQRLEIVFLDAQTAFADFASKLGIATSGSAGIYDRQSNRAFFYNALNSEPVAQVNQRIDELERQAGQRRSGAGTADAQLHQQVRRLRNQRDRLIETINLLVVQHEVAHQVFFNVGLHIRGSYPPRWVVEGLATLFESPPSAQGAGLGAVNQYRLLSLREALAGEGQWKQASAEQYAAACANGRLVPLRELVGDSSLLKLGAENLEQRYAQAWSLVFYLQNHRREDFAVYLTVLARRPSDRGYTHDQEVLLFEATFGPIDAQFERRWLDFILKQRVRPPG